LSFGLCRAKAKITMVSARRDAVAITRSDSIDALQIVELRLLPTIRGLKLLDSLIDFVF
jgi:hypothetical protein